MKNILMIYFTGSGSTENVCTIIQERLNKNYKIQMLDITKNPINSHLKNYDLLFFAMPTYGCMPPKAMQSYIESLKPLSKNKKAFLLLTYGLYQENCFREVILKLEQKNIIVNDFIGIRGPASDGVLLSPENFSFFRYYEKNISQKVLDTVQKIDNLLESKDNTIKLPKPKWYGFLNKFVVHFSERTYQAYAKQIRSIPERCINCGYCVANCPHQCWQKGSKVPVMDPEKCDFCLRCVHNCPKKAIIFNESMKDKLRLNKLFYKKIKKEITKDLKSK